MKDLEKLANYLNKIDLWKWDIVTCDGGHVGSYDMLRWNGSLLIGSHTAYMCMFGLLIDFAGHYGVVSWYEIKNKNSITNNLTITKDGQRLFQITGSIYEIIDKFVAWRDDKNETENYN